MDRPPLVLADGELSWLILQSRGPGRSVATNMGPAAPRLYHTPSNHWAYELLLDKRHREEIPETARHMARTG